MTYKRAAALSPRGFVLLRLKVVGKPNNVVRKMIEFERGCSSQL